ncbi:MAG TPA: glycosyltransferase family 2 protein [Terracidiphilus sp.]|jgi:rhamnosyltransferase
MTVPSVCAVIITYHPNASMLENIYSVLAQVRQMVIVDNGSSADELDPLRNASRDHGFHLIENGENLGIAEALNQGVRWAKSEGYPWVILFDQDSKITDGFIEQMFTAWEVHPDRERVSSIQPRYVEPEIGVEWEVRRARDGGPITSMTSGSLMPVWIFDKIGGFASEYFIDEVDTEFCFRMRAAGYHITDSRQAVLMHASGHPKKFSILGYKFRPAHHSAVRRYYMSRNRLVVYRKYFLVFPVWVLYSINVALRETIKCFLGEDDRPRKFRNLLLGTWDGLVGRMGKREGL